MRKLIILGNGFDVSHGLRTKYKEFLFNYLVKCLVKSVKNKEVTRKEYIYKHKDLLIELEFNFIVLVRGSQQNGLEVNHIYDFIREYDDFRKLMGELIKRKMIRNLNRKSLLFKIYENERIYNWVDIETEYFDKLKNILFKIQFESEQRKKITKIDKVIELNCELDFLKRELIRYLKLIVINNNKILTDDEFFTLSSEYKKILFGEFEEKFREDDTLYLNFNYTNILRDTYGKSKNLSIINIHGDLDTNLEDIIFGYGNQNDPKYNELIQLRDSIECLKNFKTFYYNDTNDYTNLKDFMIDGFEVIILGHSCGKSDSTLLTEILEHKNIKRIIVYYFDRFNDGNREEFRGKNIEISYHFEDKNKPKDLISPFDINNRIPQSPRKFDLLNDEYVVSEFDDGLISDN